MSVPGDLTTSKPLGPVAAALALAALLGGCATATPVNPRDPLEPVNRVVFEFNDGADRVFFKPVAQAYRAVLPQPVRTGVLNFFSNLQDPWIGVNNFIQGKPEEGFSDLFRFATNTVIGIGGVIDVASDMGMDKHNEDFGQTLGVWGFPSGDYLVLPFLGPSSVRDGLGLIVDGYGYGPWWATRAIDPPHRVAWRNSLTALDIVSLRARLLDTEGIFEAAALDRYSFLRDAYLQRRRNLVYDGNPPPAPREDMEPEKDPEPAGKSAPTSLETEPARWLTVRNPNLQEVAPKVPANYERVLAAGVAPATSHPKDDR